MNLPVLCNYIKTVRRNQSRLPRFFLGASCLSYDLWLTLQLAGTPEDEEALCRELVKDACRPNEQVVGAVLCVSGELQNYVRFKSVGYFDPVVVRREHVVLEGAGVMRSGMDRPTNVEFSWSAPGDRFSVLPEHLGCDWEIVCDNINVHLVVELADARTKIVPWRIDNASTA